MVLEKTSLAPANTALHHTDKSQQIMSYQLQCQIQSTRFSPPTVKHLAISLISYMMLHLMTQTDVTATICREGN
jgi:hypothetical protein